LKSKLSSPRQLAVSYWLGDSCYGCRNKIKAKSTPKNSYALFPF
jgi:hypothetical protein